MRLLEKKRFHINCDDEFHDLADDWKQALLSMRQLQMTDDYLPQSVDKLKMSSSAVTSRTSLSLIVIRRPVTIKLKTGQSALIILQDLTEEGNNTAGKTVIGNMNPKCPFSMYRDLYLQVEGFCSKPGTHRIAKLSRALRRW